MLKNIKNALDNENGGPNLDMMISLLARCVFAAGLYTVGKALHYYLLNTPSRVVIEKTGVSEQSIVVGYKK